MLIEWFDLKPSGPRIPWSCKILGPVELFTLGALNYVLWYFSTYSVLVKHSESLIITLSSIRFKWLSVSAYVFQIDIFPFLSYQVLAGIYTGSDSGITAQHLEWVNSSSLNQIHKYSYFLDQCHVLSPVCTSVNWKDKCNPFFFNIFLIFCLSFFRIFMLSLYFFFEISLGDLQLN